MQEKTKKILKAVEEDCADKAKNLTAPRRRVLACLLEADAPLKAYDIVEKMGDAKPMTVYRALDFLAGAGYVHRIESLNAYAPCVESHCRHNDSQYLICDSCGRIDELHDHSIDRFIVAQLAKLGFNVRSKTMEILGQCAACQKNLRS
jgi:Fur family zinc uptake transcriptional regulator